MNKIKAIIVVPCYNEKSRINIKIFQSHAHDYKFLFVDDGSSDGTAEFLKEQNVPNSSVFKLPNNQGKAEAVRQGMLKASEDTDNQDIMWVGFWDADMSTPIEEAYDALSYLSRHPQIKSLWCSRIYKLGSTIERTPIRHLFGRIFTTVMSLTLNLKSYDSQCGAKLFHRDVCAKVFGEIFVSKWIFDVEIAMRMNGENIEEFPVTRWIHAPGSKLSFFKDSLTIFTDLIKIRMKYGKL